MSIVQEGVSIRFSAFARRFRVIALIAFFLLSTLANSSELCIRALHAKALKTSPDSAAFYESILRDENAYRESESILVAATDDRLKEKFKIGEGLSVLASDYSKTVFSVGNATTSAGAGQRILTNVEFGYVISGGFKATGRLKSVTFSADGAIVEVVGGSQALIDEFRASIFGRELSTKDRHALDELNLKLIDFLRSIPEHRKIVERFAVSRGWPDGIAEEARLAYCGNDLSLITRWANKNGYSLSQLRDAGWLKLRFDSKGNPSYSVWASGIRIPFFSDANQTRVVGWRTRIVEAPHPDFPKYLSLLRDRSIKSESRLNEWFYGAWNITAPIDRLVITEGEFKSLVATRMAGVPTVGMLGITNYTSDLLKELTKLPVKEFVIIFDRDADGKGLMRANGVTDSQRAAYQLAIELRQAGAKSVKVGVLPDAFGDGRKVGIDDLILEMGPEAYRSVVEDALSPDLFAAQMSLDPVFQRIMNHRQALRRAIETYQNSAKRGGSEAPSTVIERAKAQLSRLEAAFKRYLKQELNVSSLYTPSALFDSLQATHEIDRRRVAAQARNGRSLSLEPLKDQIVLMDFIPSDTPSSLHEGQRTVEFPLSLAEVEAAIRTGSIRENEDFIRGMSWAVQGDFSPKSPSDYAAVLLAGYLSHTFPADEYLVGFNAMFSRMKSDGKKIIETVPVIIQKKDGTVVAFAELHLYKEGASIRFLNRVKAVLRER